MKGIGNTEQGSGAPGLNSENLLISRNSLCLVSGNFSENLLISRNSLAVEHRRRVTVSEQTHELNHLATLVSCVCSCRDVA